MDAVGAAQIGDSAGRPKVPSARVPCSRSRFASRDRRRMAELSRWPSIRRPSHDRGCRPASGASSSMRSACWRSSAVAPVRHRHGDLGTGQPARRARHDPARLHDVDHANRRAWSGAREQSHHPWLSGSSASRSRAGGWRCSLRHSRSSCSGVSCGRSPRPLDQPCRGTAPSPTRTRRYPRRPHVRPPIQRPPTRGLRRDSTPVSTSRTRSPGLDTTPGSRGRWSTWPTADGRALGARVTGLSDPAPAGRFPAVDGDPPTAASSLLPAPSPAELQDADRILRPAVGPAPCGRPRRRVRSARRPARVRRLEPARGAGVVERVPGPGWIHCFWTFDSIDETRSFRQMPSQRGGRGGGAPPTAPSHNAARSPSLAPGPGAGAIAPPRPLDRHGTLVA